MDSKNHRLTLGVDIGGTFTDLVLLRSDGRLFSKKVLSTPEDYSAAIEDGIRDLLAEADVPAAERTELEVLRSDTPTFQALVEARRNRREEWFQHAAGRIEVCNVPLVVRPRVR